MRPATWKSSKKRLEIVLDDKLLFEFSNDLCDFDNALRDIPGDWLIEIVTMAPPPSRLIAHQMLHKCALLFVKVFHSAFWRDDDTTSWHWALKHWFDSLLVEHRFICALQRCNIQRASHTTR